MVSGTYRLLDAAFAVQTDSSPFLERVEQSYSHFRDDGAQPAPIYQVILSGQPEVRIEGRIIRSDDADALAEYAYHTIVSAAEARVRSHYLFHAAALATRDGRGILLAGDAGLGKTTLAQALVAQGYGFLSDDVAAVSVTDARLDPYPRSMGVRSPGRQSAEKRFIAVREIAPSCPAHFLFVLHDPGSPVESPFWYLAVDRVGDDLLAGLRALPGVQAVEAIAGGERPMARVLLARGAQLTAGQFSAACQREGVLLYQILHDRQAPPNFRLLPRLDPLSPPEAAWELLKYLRGGAGSTAIAPSATGSATRLYVALAELAAGWACHRLSVGRLDETVELVSAATR